MELTQFGWNAVTISFLGTALFTLVESWGLWHQNKAIWKQKSGQSVSITWFSFFTATVVVVFVYGITINSIALIFNGLLLTLFHLPVLVGLWKFKGFNKAEKLLGVGLLVALAVMLATPIKDWFFLIFSFGLIASSVMQPIEIWRNKDAGVLEIKLLVSYLVSMSFWLVYSYAIRDWVLQIVAPLYLAVIVLTVAFWFRYRQPRVMETKKIRAP